MATKGTISAETKLQAFALFTLARQHYLKVREFERAMAELLPDDEEDGEYRGCISDELYDDSSHPNFDRALKRQGYTVAAKKKRR